VNTWALFSSSNTSVNSRYHVLNAVPDHLLKINCYHNHVVVTSDIPANLDVHTAEKLNNFVRDLVMGVDISIVRYPRRFESRSRGL
jgi:hypothetical protein